MATIRIVGLLVCFVWSLQPIESSASVIGPVVTFEDGTTGGWTVNLLGLGSHPLPPVVIDTGGPGGTDDAYLLLRSTGLSGSGGRFTAINVSQFTGDYIAEGVVAFTMNLNNFGPSELSLRLMFSNPIAGPPSDVAFSTDAIVVPAGSGWTSARFSVREADLTAGLGTLTDALSNVTELRLYHSIQPGFANPVLPLPAVQGALGVDNIRAVGAAAVPEPGTIGLLATGGFGVLGAWFRRRNSHLFL